MFRMQCAISALVVVVASLLIFSGPAYAHERRTVGQFDLEVGWLVEPAFVGQLNGLALKVVDTRSHGPVSGLEKTLAVEVAAGGLAPFALPLTAGADPGEYTSSFMPTVAGSYTFHVTGKIGTQTLDEKFSSGPNTFDDVAAVTALQYPAKVPVGADLGKALEDLKSGVLLAQLIAIVAWLTAMYAVIRILMRERRP